jgi:uncharacterized protein YbjT (DUF2867 family)
MPRKTAILFGASGLVGEKVLMRLLSEDKYEKIKIFSRSEISFQHEKISLTQTDFSDFDKIKQDITGNDLFCCLGTTRKKAGSQENFRKIDFDLVLNIAKAAYENQVTNFLVISSVGANAQSRNFYLRTKGEMEKEILQVPFQKTVILRPSLLMGKRKEFRFLESVGKVVFGFLSFLLIGRLRKYKPNYAGDVAAVMVRLANVTTSKKIFEPNDINLFSSTT